MYTADRLFWFSVRLDRKGVEAATVSRLGQVPAHPAPISKLGQTARRKTSHSPDTPLRELSTLLLNAEMCSVGLCTKLCTTGRATVTKHALRRFQGKEKAH